MNDEKTTVPGVYRAKSTGALINKDNKALEAYKKRKQAARTVPILLKKIEEMEKVMSDMISRIERLEENKCH